MDYAAVYERLTDVSKAYIETVIYPYTEVLEPANFNEIIKWLPEVFNYDDVDEIVNNILQDFDDNFDDNSKAESAKSTILNFIRANWLKLLEVPEDYDITPWDLSGTRDQQIEQLIGPAEESLEIEVKIGPNKYSHVVTEELAYGLLLALDGHLEYLILMNGYELNINDICHKYQRETGVNFNYSANVNGYDVVFDSEDLIQGVVTAASWINVDPHDIITNFMNDELFPQTF